jgi:hypothetical protein
MLTTQVKTATDRRGHAEDSALSKCTAEHEPRERSSSCSMCNVYSQYVLKEDIQKELILLCMFSIFIKKAVDYTCSLP